MAARRVRIVWTEARQFPDWWTKSAVGAAFTVVSSRPDVCLLPLPSWTWTEDQFDAARRLAEASTLPTVVYYPFDSWDDPARGWQGPAAWAEPLHRYVLAADVVVGPSLPATGGPLDVVPLPYPPLVRRLPAPPGLLDATFDVHFAGFFKEPGWAGPPVDTRDRRYRGHLVARLRERLPADRLHVRRVSYWADGEEQKNLRRRYVRELDRSTMVLAPAGYGHLTFRHADGWSRGRVVLSEPVQRRVAVPEPERWAAGEICVTYDPARDDIADVVEQALDSPARLERVAAAGWDYGRRWADRSTQPALLATALRARFGPSSDRGSAALTASAAPS